MAEETPKTITTTLEEESLGKNLYAEPEVQEASITPELLAQGEQIRTNIQSDMKGAFEEIPVLIDKAKARTDLPYRIQENLTHLKLPCSEVQVQCQEPEDPSVKEHDLEYILYAHVKDAEGNRIAWVARTIYYEAESGEWKVHRSQILVDPLLRGCKIGSHIIKSEEAAYRKQGIREIQLDAGGTDGIHFNAIMGFDFVDPNVRHKANSDMLSYLSAHPEIDRIQIGERRIGIDAFDVDGLSAPELARLRAYDQGQNELFFPAQRLRGEDILKANAKKLAIQFFERIGEEYTPEVARIFEEVSFCGEAIQGILINPSNEERPAYCKLFFEQRARYAESSFGAEASRVWNRVVNEDEVLGLFVEMIEAVGLSEITETLELPLGEAFFKDMGKDKQMDGWRGKKRLDA